MIKGVIMPNKKPDQKPRGRPVEFPMPGAIPDTPENLARIVANTPPPEKWEYIKRRKKGFKGQE